MNLVECDGKSLLARYGCPIPRGALWPRLPEGFEKLVVKAQVPSGKRGKQGGILFAESPEEANALARDLSQRRIGEHDVVAVYVEERLAIARELYLAVALDRDAGCETVIASTAGGMSIEEVAEDRIRKLSIEPLMGLRGFHAAEVARFLADGGELSVDAFIRVVATLYRMAREEDAELVEINPLAVLEDGRVVAADAKIVLDDNGAFRRSFEPAVSPQVQSGSALERAIAATGAVAVEVDSDGAVIAVVSGAGLMMATLDLLKDRGLAVRCVIDLGGTVLAGGDGLQRVFEAVVGVSPRVTFFNAFLHTAHCDEFARMLGAAAQEASPVKGQVIVRLKGRNAETGRRLLEARGFRVFEDLVPAIDAVESHTIRGEVD